jgi:hypothetical protein
MAAGNGQILEQTMAAFIAHRTIVGMVQHQPFDNMFTEIDNLFIRGRYHHAVPGIDHTAHLHAFNRTLYEFYRTYSTGPNRPQGRVIAKPRNHDAQFFGGINHFGPRGNFYFLFVDNQFRHEKPLTIDDCRLMIEGVASLLD